MLDSGMKSLLLSAALAAVCLTGAETPAPTPTPSPAPLSEAVSISHPSEAMTAAEARPVGGRWRRVRPAAGPG